MNVSADTIDLIVQNVLQQLDARVSLSDREGSGETVRPSRGSSGTLVAAQSAEDHGPVEVSLDQRLVTAEDLAELKPGVRLRVPQKCIITPAGWDVARERRLQITRVSAAERSSNEKVNVPDVASRRLLIVVRQTPALERLADELLAVWRRELLSCPDDAAQLAIAEISRGGAPGVVIVTEQTHRAACLANRNASVKAAAIREPGDIRLIRRQLKVNVWCVDPEGKSAFELRTLLREAATSGSPRK